VGGNASPRRAKLQNIFTLADGYPMPGVAAQLCQALLSETNPGRPVGPEKWEVY
jgi:hypothetical protein